MLSTVIDRELEEKKSQDPSGPRIRCPLCGWSPRKEDKWSCTCGHEWNTFDTGGVCRACLHQWTETQCKLRGFSEDKLKTIRSFAKFLAADAA